MFAANSVIDPYVLATAPAGQTDNKTIDGYTQVYPGLVTGQSTGVFVLIGQSNTAGNDNTKYTPTNALAHNLNLYNGGVYRAKDPLLGCCIDPATGGSYGGRLADKLINTGKYARVVLVPISVGGTIVAQWASGGTYNHRIAAACRRIAAVGLPITGILWTQGETDAVNGTSQSAYTGSITSVISTFRGFTNAPFLVGLETWDSGSLPAGSSAIRAAQAAVVDNLTVFQGADGDTLNNTNRYDNTHWNATGSDAFAGLWQTAINAHF